MTTTAPRRLKTWSIAGNTRRKPTEYEIATGNFHYHFNRKPAPFDLDPETAINRWYIKHREGSPLRADDWEGFRDPAALSYRRYIALQHDREIYAEGVVDHYETLNHDEQLDPAWVAILERGYVPARFVYHVLQITGLYLGQLAPSAYITNASFFQAADELRALQWIAYRAKSLSLAHGPHLANSEATRRIWELDEAWQPARETLERLLLAYDWGEAFVALNLVVKPTLDALFKESFAELAASHGDGLTAALLQESRVDTIRSQAWSTELARYSVAANPANRDVLARWQAEWQPLADRAVDGLATIFADAPRPNDPVAVSRRVAASVSEFQSSWQ
ncbi:aromatic/alkene monooxygenase hydroxylase subunit beta [Mycobacterium sp. Aquia_213]|uniref:aromatic/alkene monooxygenase hydroxylase subunit beta n=1 Tax=Mycobacterium sp. Aquia_213 TaxID=2991728 RepID=UPI0022713137|nr:aromatic/alkene monooxygenase hydroxylase subunit beta [Mycobacterium sp. Aquia_213]WAC94113.1 aromatic/alkene monooxygenase hydroxylase subunit beta [Mycobacterium sp. Aquia_213]